MSPLPRAALLALLALGCSKKPSAPAAAARPADAAVVATAAPPAPAAPPPGPEVCADCHPDEAFGFAETGMGRSLYRPGARPPIEDFSPEKATITNPKNGLVYRAYIDEEGRWWQEESLPGTDYHRRVEVTHVIGSGNHTRSYLGEVEGEVIQMPLTWYVRRGIWDMSPGYAETGHRFDRHVQPQCLFCHNDLSPIRDHTTSGYLHLAEGITCTRCHGDGTAHVAQRRAGEGPVGGQPDPTIVNPARLQPIQQLRVCQQCHLSGQTRVLLGDHRWDHYDVRTPLEDYVSIYEYANNGGPEFGISSHGLRMSLSRCYTESEGRLNCSRCHNPHRKDEGQSRRAACLGCHQVEQCGDEHGKTADADCARCHMHQGGTSDIPHVTFTDHWIRARPGGEPQPAPSRVELADVLAETRRGPDPEAPLRLGLAHALIWRHHGRDQHQPDALRLLQAGLRTHPDRTDAWYELGRIFMGMRNHGAAAEVFRELEKRAPGEALFRLEQAQNFENLGDLEAAERALRKAVELHPRFRAAWVNLGNVLQHQGRLDDAAAAYDRADEIGPYNSATANNRGYLEISRGRLEQAEQAFRDTLRRDGLNPMGNFNLATLSLKRGDRVGARQHLEDALKRDPKFALAWWIRGRMNLEDGDLAGARRDLQRATELAPQNAEAYLDLARAARAAGDHGTASEVLMRASMQVPTDPRIRQALIEGFEQGP